MASTFSPALRLELMATGDQSGTWGDTTNTNLGTLLEQAITGYLSVAQGDVANLTLTTVNGGSDQARNAVVRITGALTATRNVVVQTAAKLYTIANDTTGGFSIVVKTSAGTGVSIPPGAMMNVYSDGTNVVQGANYWNGQIGGAAYLDAGATVGPVFDLFRDSTSPAASDILGQLIFNGRDSAGNKQEYASIQSTITAATSTSEASTLDFYEYIAGARVNVLSLAGGTSTFLYTDAGAAVGPVLDLYRNSASPAVSDILGKVIFNGQDSGAAKQEYGSIEAVIIDPTAASEDASMDHYAVVAGTRTRIISVGPNLDLAAVGQIQFPATQNPSSGANVLDDYEEGTTTPTITASSGTFTSVSAALSYRKIGSFVGGYGRITITTVGTAAGVINLPLPFTAAAVNGAGGGTVVRTSDGVMGYVLIGTGGTNATIARYDAAAIIAATTIDFAFTYIAAA